MPSERERAWADVHDPATSGARLAEIGAAHPEFAAAIAAHPHCYPALAEWARTEAEAGAVADDPSAPAVSTSAIDVPPASVIAEPAGASAEPEPALQPAMAAAASAADPGDPGADPRALTASPSRRPSRRLVIGGIAGAVALVAVVGVAIAAVTGGWFAPRAAAPAAAPESSQTATPAPTASRVLDGDPVYLGDELTWLLPTDAELSQVVPGVLTVSMTAGLRSIGESEGLETTPSECIEWILPDRYSVVGSRGVEWTVSGAEDYEKGRATALQFPSSELAAEYLRAFTDSLAACASFELSPEGTQEQLVETGSNDSGMAVAATQTGTTVGAGATQVIAAQREGNVVVWLQSPTGTTDPADGAEILGVLESHAQSARAQLTDEIGYR